MPLPRREYDRSINAEIERLLYQVKVIRQEAEGLYWGLTEAQWHWAPGEGGWSIAQCFDHLNITNRLFIAAFETSIRQARAEKLLSDGPFAYGFFSRWMYRVMQPPVKRRFKAPKKFEPAGRRKPEEILAEWEATHERLSELIREANGLNLVKAKVTSPASNFIRYPLGMGFWIQTAHDRRHLWQARQVRNHPAFPGA